ALSNARPTARRRSRTRASSRKPCANKAGMSSSKAWDNSALALWMASRYLGSMATSPGKGGKGRDWFCLKRRCHDSGRKKSHYQRSLITPEGRGQGGLEKGGLANGEKATCRIHELCPRR